MWQFFLICLQFPLIYMSPVRNNVCRSFSDYATIETNKNCYYNLDVDLSVSQLVKRYGFPFESYKVKTEDGYILSLFRIPHDGKDQKTSRQPVVLQHGISASAAIWLLLGEESLAFFLVNNGYDVWLANFRGTTYSTGHENSEITEKQYWNFSFHEVGIYDLPAYIEFISQTTGRKDIIYIGHSMGSTACMVYSSLKKKHAEKYLKTIILLAPAVYLRHTQGLMWVLAQYSDVIKDISEGLGFFGIGQFIELQKDLAKVTCNTYPLIIICQAMYALLAGLSLDQENPEMFPFITLNLLTGTSVKTLHHYGQIIVAHGRFQFYDYGLADNMAFYNSTIPPEYPVEEISISTHLFSGSKDFIAEYEDVKFLHEKLRCNKSLHEFEMAHNDFIFGGRVALFQKTLLKVMKSG